MEEKREGGKVRFGCGKHVDDTKRPGAIRGVRQKRSGIVPLACGMLIATILPKASMSKVTRIRIGHEGMPPNHNNA